MEGEHQIPHHASSTQLPVKRKSDLLPAEEGEDERRMKQQKPNAPLQVLGDASLDDEKGFSDQNGIEDKEKGEMVVDEEEGSDSSYEGDDSSDDEEAQSGGDDVDDSYFTDDSLTELDVGNILSGRRRPRCACLVEGMDDERRMKKEKPDVSLQVLGDASQDDNKVCSNQNGNADKEKGKMVVDEEEDSDSSYDGEESSNGDGDDFDDSCFSADSLSELDVDNILPGSIRPRCALVPKDCLVDENDDERRMMQRKPDALLQVLGDTSLDDKKGCLNQNQNQNADKDNGKSILSTTDLGKGEMDEEERCDSTDDEDDSSDDDGAYSFDEDHLSYSESTSSIYEEGSIDGYDFDNSDFSDDSLQELDLATSYQHGHCGAVY